MLRTLFTQTGWSLIGTVFGFVVGFFVKMYLVNKVGATDFGLYTIATSFQGAVSTLISFGIPHVIIKFLPRYTNKDEDEKATTFVSKSLLLLLGSGILSAILIISTSSLLAEYLFNKPNLSYMLALAALYIPLSMYSAYLVSIYRSFLKIKEIILYGTIYMVSIRAVLTLTIFSFTDNIIYFLLIEIFSYTVSVILLTINFKNPKIRLFKLDAARKKLADNEKEEIVKFAKTIYSNSLVGFAGGYIMTFMMSILLPASTIGIFAILMTIAGLTNFLQSNINSVFAPMISSLINKKDLDQLSNLYKESTFVINFVTIPFIVSAILFSKEILGLYGEEFSPYTFELMVLFLANYLSLAVGSSGTMMLMCGLEKEELYLQVFILFFTIFVSLIFLPTFGLLAVVFIRLITMFIINTVEIYYIRRHIRIWPWDIYSYLLMTIFILLLVLSYRYHNHQFEWLHYISIPILLYVFFALFFYKKLLVIKELILKK